MGDRSPFIRSEKIVRSPPPTPSPRPTENENAQPPTAAGAAQTPETVSSNDLMIWLNSIEHCLNEICSISTEGKLNSEQKLKISNLCRKVSNGSANLALHYQSLKKNALVNHCMVQALQEKQDLSSRLQALKQTIDSSSKPSTTLSFADMVKSSDKNMIKPNNLSSVAIYPTDKMKTSEDTKNLVQKIIKPEEMKLHVRAVRKVKNGGVIISTESKDDIEKLKKTFQKTSPDLTIDEPHKRRPRIVIIGVPSSLQEQEVYKCIYEQNLADNLKDSSRQSFLSSIKLSHKSGRKDADTCNYVIEVPALVRKALISQHRVFVNWSSCPVRDFTFVTRCYKCQQFGHAAKTCKQAEYTCGHCGDMGHVDKECAKKAEPPKCATCRLFKKPNNHRTGDSECPAKKMAEQRYINSIDYEGA